MRKYIDAEVLVKKMQERGWRHPDETTREFVEDDLPAADVQEVRHGRWEDETYTAGALKMYGHKCSVCGAITPVSVARYRYCPNCGSRMDLREEE